MAKATTPRLSVPRLLCLLMLVPLAAAVQFKVGGSNGWSVPADPNANSYNQWAQRNRFHIGDSLVFVYPADKDSVLRVTQEDYSKCNTTSPLARSDDGNTAFIFNQSGLYYFISGVKENCLKKEVLVVRVLADRNQSGSAVAPASSSPPPPPPPSPVPASSSPPRPPNAEVAPASPPPGGVFTSAAPEATSPPLPPPNAASLKVVGIMGSIGAFVGSLALFVL